MVMPSSRGRGGGAACYDAGGSSSSLEEDHGNGGNETPRQVGVGVFVRTAHNMSSSSSSLLRKKSDLALLNKVLFTPLKKLLANLHEIFLGTKLFLLLPAVPLAVAAHYYQYPMAWIFALSLLGLTPLAERVSFLTEQIAYYTSPTVGGLLNATCGNATELIVAIFALRQRKIDVVKCSLVGSILSNLLLVLGTSLFCGGLVNLRKEQLYNRKQADINSGLLLLCALCHMLTLMFKYAIKSSEGSAMVHSALDLSRACSIIMLLAYVAYLFFQLKTHRHLFEPHEVNYQMIKLFLLLKMIRWLKMSQSLDSQVHLLG